MILYGILQKLLVRRFQSVDSGTYKLIGAVYNKETGAACIYQNQPPKIGYVRSVVFAEDQIQIESDNGEGSWEQTDFLGASKCGDGGNTNPVPLISPRECPFRLKPSIGH